MSAPTTIPMPRLTEQMEEATIAKWLIEPGQRVEVGDELVEIETDKATMAYASEAAGHLEPLVEEGDAVAVDQPIAKLHPTAVPAADGHAAPPRTVPPATSPATDPYPASAASLGAAHEATADATTQHPPTDRNADALATPLARRAAQDLGIALGAVEGSGPRGRILKGDVLLRAGRGPDPASRPTPAVPGRADRVTETAEVAAAAAAMAATAPAASPQGQTGPSGDERRPMTTIQRTIARRMAEAKATVPHFQVSCDVTVDAILATRRDLRDQLDDGTRGPSLNDFIVRACALALRDHELVNASFAGDHFELHAGIHVGIAVAGDDGLMVATVTDADRRSIVAVANETRRLASAVRSGTATPAELTGATFTISNLGMFGMTSIVPVINPPQAAILGVGAAREELYLREGQPTSRQVATLTLSGDHRILNGADAARFLGDVKRLMQAPLRLLAT